MSREPIKVTKGQLQSDDGYKRDARALARSGPNQPYKDVVVKKARNREGVMKEFEPYQSAVLDAMAGAIKPLMEDRSETDAAGKALWNHLFDLPGPKQAGIMRAPSSMYVGRVFEGFAEIFNSLETLDDISSLVGSPPERRPRISEERYLQFLVEAHLNEVYLLRERLRGYVKSIQRAFKRDPRSNEVFAKTEALTKAIDPALGPFLRLRHAHVHEGRFRDEGISRLGSIKLLLLSDDPKIGTVMRAHYRVQQASVMKRWRKIMKGNSRAVRDLTGSVFEGLYPLVFNKDTGEVSYPAEFAPKSP
jgi:hypothetical protein